MHTASISPQHTSKAYFHLIPSTGCPIAFDLPYSHMDRCVTGVNGVSSRDLEHNQIVLPFSLYSSCPYSYCVGHSCGAIRKIDSR